MLHERSSHKTPYRASPSYPECALALVCGSPGRATARGHPVLFPDDVLAVDALVRRALGERPPDAGAVTDELDSLTPSGLSVASVARLRPGGGGGLWGRW